MAQKEAGSSLDSVISRFNAKITELQDLVVARNMYPASSVTDLLAVDTTLKAVELQVHSIKDRLREETEVIPKAKKLINASLRQQKLQSMSAYVPAQLPERAAMSNLECNRSLPRQTSDQQPSYQSMMVEEEPAALPREKKGRGSPPLWYITSEELDSLSTYMRGRLTLDKINAAVNDIAAYAEANAQLIAAPKKKMISSRQFTELPSFVFNSVKLAENLWDKALELRDIAMTEAAKGKHFFLETDVKGPSLKLDNSGKAILTILCHLRSSSGDHSPEEALVSSQFLRFHVEDIFLS